MSVLGRVGPQVNKYEQVSSDDHQMSVDVWYRVELGVEGVGPMSGIGDWTRITYY